MKVFISCTNSLSKDCANILRDWIAYVSTTSEPLISSRISDKTDYWFLKSYDRLIEVEIGLICLDKSNKDDPWILFETGSLIKQLGRDNVYTFLIDLAPEELQPPIALIEHILPNKESMRKLVYAINNKLGTKMLNQPVLDELFETCWPWFEERFNEISTTPADPANNEDSNSLAKVLYNSKSLGNRIKYMRLKNRQLHADGNFSRMELIDRVSKMKLVDRIAFLIKKGLPPEQIASELEGIAPTEYIMDVSNFMYEHANLEDIEPNP